MLLLDSVLSIKFPCVYLEYLIRHWILEGTRNIDSGMIKDQKVPTPDYLRTNYLRYIIGSHFPLKCESIARKLILLSWPHTESKLKIPDGNTLSGERGSTREWTKMASLSQLTEIYVMWSQTFWKTGGRRKAVELGLTMFSLVKV